MAENDQAPQNNLLQHHVVRFAIVGIINTLLDIGVYALLRNRHAGIFLANLCSTSLALSVSFILNRHYTFQAHGKKLHRQIVRFFPITLVGLWVLQPVCIYLLTSLLPELSHISVVLPKLGATGASLVWNFFWYRNYVFAED